MYLSQFTNVTFNIVFKHFLNVILRERFHDIIKSVKFKIYSNQVKFVK